MGHKISINKCLIIKLTAESGKIGKDTRTTIANQNLFNKSPLLFTHLE